MIPPPRLTLVAAIVLAACGGGQDAPVVVTVPAPSITVSAAATSLNVIQGGNATLAITVARNNGFAGPVDLTVEGAPAGITSTLTASTLPSGSTSTSLTVTAAGTLVAGSYPLTVRGRGQGVADVTAGVTLVVAPPSVTNISLNLCGDNPLWIAAQSDDGAWVQLTPTAANTISFSVIKRGGLAVAYPSVGYAGGTFLTYASASEFATMSATNNASCAGLGTKVLYGSVTNLGSAYAQVALGYANASLGGGSATTTFTLNSAPDQASDLVLVRIPTANAWNVDKIIIRRGYNLPTGAGIPRFDLASSEGFAPGAAKATIVGLGADAATITSNFGTATFTNTTLFDGPATTQQSFPVIPENQLVPGDIQQLVVSANSANASRGAVRWFHTPSDQTMTLGPALATPVISTVSAAAPQRLRLQLPSQQEYGTVVSVLFYQPAATAVSAVGLTVTASYAGGTPSTWDLAIPDLSAAGYKAEWGLRAATSTNWSVLASNQTSTANALLVPDGTTEMDASRFGPVSGLTAARAWITRSPFMHPLLALPPRSPLAVGQHLFGAAARARP